MYVALNPHYRHLSPDHFFLELAYLDTTGTMLQLGQRTFTHNTAVVPIIVACIIEDSINDLVGCEAFLGWVVW